MFGISPGFYTKAILWLVGRTGIVAVNFGQDQNMYEQRPLITSEAFPLLAGGLVVMVGLTYLVPEVGTLLLGGSGTMALAMWSDRRSPGRAHAETLAQLQAAHPLEAVQRRESAEVDFHRWQRERLYEDETAVVLRFHKVSTQLLHGNLLLMRNRAMDLDELFELEMNKGPRFELDVAMGQVLDASAALYLHVGQLPMLVQAASNFSDEIWRCREAIEDTLYELESAARLVVHWERQSDGDYSATVNIHHKKMLDKADELVDLLEEPLGLPQR